MDKITIDKLKDIIERKAFDELKGSAENEFFECKAEPYRINEDPAKRELAKDITSFANSNGGYILVGVGTEKDSAHSTDIVKKISYLNIDLIDQGRYRDIAKSWIYPEIQDLVMFWVTNDQDIKRGIFVIHIPPQNAFRKPFLIAKHVDENGKRKSELVFGYAERKAEYSEPKKIHEIHNLIRDGMHYTENIERRFDKIEEMLGHVQGNKKEKRREGIDQEIMGRITDVLKVNNMSSKRASVLVGYVEDQGVLKTIFDTKEGSIYNKIRCPGSLRYAGWSLETLDTPKIISGQYIQACNGERKTLRLYRDGALFFAADQGFWLWPKEEQGKINCLGVVESVYNFVNLYNDVLKDFNVKTIKGFLKFGVFNYHQDNVPSFLCAGSLASVDYQFATNPKVAPEDQYISPSYSFDFSEMSVPVIAYNLVKEIYLWFGIMEGEGRIPYVTEKDGLTFVDTDKIINARAV